MKACSFIIDNKILVIMENEHKEVKVIFGGQKKDFPSYKDALHWVQIKKLNGDRYIVNC